MQIQIQLRLHGLVCVIIGSAQEIIIMQQNHALLNIYDFT